MKRAPKLIKCGSRGGAYPLQDVLEVMIHNDCFEFWGPSADDTGKVQWVKPLNMDLAYALLYSGEWALVHCGTLTDWPKRILSTHASPEEMRGAFFVEQDNRRAGCYS